MTDLEKIKRIIDVEYHDVLANIGSEIHHGKIFPPFPNISMRVPRKM
jgi:hypothetical protein